MAYLASTPACYEFRCPEGMWLARFVHKESAGNFGLKLVFTDIATEKNYALAITWNELKSLGHDFEKDLLSGDVFALITESTENIPCVLKSARRILRAPGPSSAQSNSAREVEKIPSSELNKSLSK